MKRSSFFDLLLDAALDVARGTSVLKEATTEFTGEHNGQEFDFALRQFITGLGFPVFMKAGAKHQNEKLTSFLYGVQDSEQLPNRVAYDPRHVLIPYIAANAIYGVTERISLFGNVGLAFYPYKVLDSQIVNKQISFNLIGSLAFYLLIPVEKSNRIFMCFQAFYNKFFRRL